MTARLFPMLGLLLVLLARAEPALAQAPHPLFSADTPLQLTIEAPIAALTRNRGAAGAVAGTIAQAGGESVPITLQMRGITRRTAEICDFPPLRVTFTALPPAGSPFAGQRRLKLVTHCRDAQSFRQHVLLEYAAYRLYNLLTPRSFRVRLANIRYQGDGRRVIERPGFFIEDLDDVARRNAMREIHAGPRIPISDLNPTDAARYALFQHMIGNHDWSMRAGPVGDDCCHNAKLIGAPGPGNSTPIPYDFDYSGLVSAPYAVPPNELRLQNVRQRLYRGYCAHNGQALAAARQMRDTRPQMLAILARLPGLDPRAAARATTYLETFFADIATDAIVGAKVLNRCVS